MERRHLRMKSSFGKSDSNPPVVGRLHGKPRERLAFARFARRALASHTHGKGDTRVPVAVLLAVGGILWIILVVILVVLVLGFLFGRR